MKKLGLVFLLVIVMLMLTVSPVMAGDNGKKIGATIQDGTILDKNGNVLKTGYDDWGYNYQAHLFNGLYENFSRPAVPVTMSDTKLMMKWNEAWLSNMDRDNDHLLDRHYGFTSYRGSSAWLTNHMVGTYEMDGKVYTYTYFVKIVAVPLDAVKVAGIWYEADGTEIGPDIWGEFATIEEIFNDSGAGSHGLIYKSPACAGFGYFKP